MAIVLVDSCVYIDLLRHGKDPARSLTDEAMSVDLAVCGIVRLEVLRGIHNSNVRDAMDAFMETMIEIPANRAFWDRSISMAWTLERSGVQVPNTNFMIACAALQIGATVLSTDKHFDRIPGIRVVRSFRDIG